MRILSLTALVAFGPAYDRSRISEAGPLAGSRSNCDRIAVWLPDHQARSPFTVGISLHLLLITAVAQVDQAAD